LGNDYDFSSMYDDGIIYNILIENCTTSCTRIVSTIHEMRLQESFIPHAEIQLSEN